MAFRSERDERGTRQRPDFGHPWDGLEVIHNPRLRILESHYLIKLAFENLGEAEPGEEEQVESVRFAHKSFWSVVVGVELADLAFSLDNVVAVVAISDNYWLLLFGVVMGILTMRFAASQFSQGHHISKLGNGIG